MLNFLHTYHPVPVIFQIGRITFHWYGFFIILGIILGLLVILKLSQLYQIEKERIYNLSFLLIIFGLIGARIFDFIFYNWDYFLKYPLDIFKIQQGGMSIHGALIGGIVALLFYCYYHKLSFWLIADLFTPGLILGQAIGRWGNYFNQELYGRSTLLPIGIPINLENRIVGYEGFNYFHPTFFYEFILNLIILGILIWLHRKSLKSEKYKEGSIFLTYLILYSLSRFLIEFLRIDPQPTILNLRFGQWISLLIVILSLVMMINKSPCFLFRQRSQNPDHKVRN